jgi:DNA gyrase/topoisomerase IV subunit A
VDARLAAVERRDELVRLIGDAEGRESARAAVQRLLSLSASVADDVLDMRLASLTQEEVKQLQAERRELAKRIEPD